MAQAQSILDSLPVEVIRRVAVSGTCIEALTLMKVNRRLFRSCRDWNVFQRHIIGNQNCLNRKTWDISFLTPQTSADAWARYAVADLRIGELLLQAENSVDFGQISIASYAPQLVVTHHPLMNLQAVERLSRVYFSSKCSDSHRLALAFTIAACVLSGFDSGDLTDAARIECYKSLSGFNTRADMDERSPSLCLWHACPLPSTRGEGDIPGTNLDIDPFLDKTIFKAYSALPFFFYELKIALAMNNFFHPQGANEADLPPELPTPPVAVNIPFLSFVHQIPLPFSPSSPELITTSHIPLMTSASFLISGTWAGYLYTNTPQLSASPRFQYPMFSIQFHINADVDIPHEVLFTTTGSMYTAKGSFAWSGVMDCRTGKMDMDARYHDDEWMIPLSWQAIMTPFGIVGSMGGTWHAHWMWLWKEEWCASDVKVKDE